MRPLPENIIPNRDNQKIAATREVMATFANVDFHRTRFWCLCASVAVEYPRRLGQYATRQELSYDKRVSRKICYIYQSVWGMFHKETEAPPPPEWTDWPVVVIDPMMNRIGATVIWERQIDYLINVVNTRIRSLSDFEEMTYIDGVKRWQSKHEYILRHELDSLHRVKKYTNEKRPTSMQGASPGDYV